MGTALKRKVGNVGHVLGLAAGLIFLASACSTSVHDRPAPLTVDPTRQVTHEGENLKPFLLARPGGGAYLAWARRQGERTSIQFAVSQDGLNYGPPLQLSTSEMDLDLGAENGPQAVVGPNGDIHVVWVAGSLKAPAASHGAHGVSHSATGGKGPPARPGNLNIYLASSYDEGKSFSVPKKLNDDPDGTEHRFPAIAVDSRGAMCVIWLDKRLQSADRPDFSRVFFTRSTDGGRTFSANVDATQGQDHGICHCCKLALATHPRWGIYIAYRNDVHDTRDMYLTHSRDHGRTFSKPAPIENTGWIIPGCPMDGPSLAMDDVGQLHAVWMTRGNVPGVPATGAAPEESSSVLYRRFDLNSLAWSDPLYLAAGTHPRMALDPTGTAYVVWKQDGLHLARLRAGGAGKVETTALSRPEALASFPSLGRSPKGGPLVAWQQQDGDGLTQIFIAIVGASNR